MKVDEHVSYKKEFIKKRADTLIITPIYLNYEMLAKHLGLLSKQTVQNFDVILVLNGVTDEKRVIEIVNKQKPEYGIIIVKRREDNGSSGGFFVGEVYALENNYSLIIYAEDDCLPVDGNIISVMVSDSRKYDIGNTTVRLLVNEDIWLYGGGLHMYCYVRTDILRKVGLHYPPIYLGADDMEMGIRISKVARASVIKNEATHPYLPPLFTEFKRSLLYRVNRILFLEKLSIWYLWNLVVVDLIYILFGSGMTRRAGTSIISNVLAFKYGKEALDTFDNNIGELRNETEFKNRITLIPKKGEYWYNIKEKANKELFKSCKYLVRKEVLIYPAPHGLVLLSMLLAKKTYITSKKGCWLMSDNSNLILHLIRWGIFLVLLPPSIIFGLIIWIVNTFRRPKTWRYGLD